MTVELSPCELSEEQRKLQKALLVQMVEVYKVISTEDKTASIWGQLGHLVRKARLAVDKQQTVREQISQLLQLVYREWGFHCDPDTHFNADSMLIDQILQRHQGSALSLGALVLYLAESLNLPLFPVNFPTQLVLRSDLNGETIFINPWDGEFLAQDTLDKWIEGYIGFGEEPEEHDLSVAEGEQITTYLVQYIKNALMREDRHDESLRLIAWCLSKKPEDPYEIRDRGLVYSSMNCVHLALPDFDYFVTCCPDDHTSDLLRDQLMGAMVAEYSIH